MAKKLFALLLAVLMLLCCACGEDTDKDQDKDKDRPTKSTSSSKEETTAPTEEEPSEEPSEEEEPTEEVPEPSEEETTAPTEAPTEPEPVYGEIYHWQEEMVFVRNEGVDYVMDTEGKLLFQLPEDVFYAMGVKTGETKVFFGDYAPLDNNTVIDRKGEVVFDLADTEFDAIAYYECLDIGYLICSKEVNSFEETGTHYYRVNISDGEAVRLEGERIPMGEDFWYYFGNGYFVYAPANYGFECAHTLYNMKKNEFYEGYRLDEDGKKFTDAQPNMYFLPGFSGDRTTKPTMDDVYIYVDKERSIHYDLATGRCDITGIAGIIGVDNIKVEGGTGVDKVVELSHLYYQDGIYLTDYYLFDCVRDTYIDMNDYASYEVYAQSAKGSYLATVTNEGGGKFVTVINAKGERKFEPIPYVSFMAYSSKYFVILTEEEYVAYNWKGEELATWSSDRYFCAGKGTVLLANEEVGCTLLNLTTGEMKEFFTEAFVGIKDVRFADGRYIFREKLLQEDGTVVYMELG